MTTKVSLDKGGRLVLPKSLCKNMQLEPGDTLVVEREGEQITLRPVRHGAPLQKELGISVYQGESSDVFIPKLIDRERMKRLREPIP
jgi:AbrB family looped-hinge helix DNA binding protein